MEAADPGKKVDKLPLSNYRFFTGEALASNLANSLDIIALKVSSGILAKYGIVFYPKMTYLYVIKSK
ncbi:MAG TPA: hypothetical protein DDX40_04780 [Rikenellaceae bacterium]|nr:hypothetical protein [Rikenellaceae bacterium]